MQVKPSLLRYRVASIPKDDKGTYEPEQMPAQVSIPRDNTTLSLGAGALDPSAAPQGSIPTTLTLETTAGDMANQVRSRCMLCKHFDAAAWKVLKRHWESSVEGIETLNKMRGALYLHGDVAMVDRHKSMEGDQDLEHTLMAMGICQVLTEIDRDVCVVYGPFGGCPVTSKTGAPVKTESQPLGYFTPCSTDAERVGAQNYDSILMAALKNKP